MLKILLYYRIFVKKFCYTSDLDYNIISAFQKDLHVSDKTRVVERKYKIANSVKT